MKACTKSIAPKVGLLVLSTLLTLFAAEFILRFIYPKQLTYYVWQPGLKHIFYPDTSVLGGVSPVSNFTINAFGVRHAILNSSDEDLFKPATNNSKYILCLGGSTTECLYLDDIKTWPQQIERLSREDNLPIFAGNIGKSGCTSRENYIQLKYCVPRYKRVNAVVLMTGLNDLVKYLAHDTLFTNGFQFTAVKEDSLVHQIFLRKGRGEEVNGFHGTALFYAIQNFYHRFNNGNVSWEIEDDSAKIYKVWREHRLQASRIIDILPDLTKGLNDYEQNLNLIIDEANRQKLGIYLVNQAALWSDSLEADANKLLWMGGTGDFQKEGGHSYYSAKILRQALDIYNRKLAEVCEKRKKKLIDIDAQLPRSPSIFYDDCHFTEAGANEVAKIIYREIKKDASYAP